MVLEKLGDSLKNTLGKIAKSVFVDEKLINELVKDIQRALLQSDTNVQLVFDLSKKIKERAKEDTAPGITKREQLVKIVYEELTNFLGKETSELKIEKKPTQIMLVGLFGSGKTTTTGKLAKFYKKRGYKVAVMQTDTWRPAAYDQLEQLAKSVGVEFFGVRGEKDPVNIYMAFQDKIKDYDVVIVDTAGRDALSEDLIEELNQIHSVVKPDERLLVISADIGQAAQKQAQAFHDTVDVNGVIVTKLEGTAKGGGALSACSVTNAPIKFIGIGEKVDDLEIFHPQRFVGRLIGFGDIESLLEKAKEVMNEDDAKDMQDKFLKGDFNLLDLYNQMKSLKKMGSFKKIMGMIPGMSNMNMPKEMLDVQEGKLEKWKIAMDSMTQEELEEPDKIGADRVDRIASGSGSSIKEVRELLKQHRQSKKMMKMFKGEKDMNKMMKKMKGKMPGGMKF
ncbi:signal recognition particle protein [Candidatus Woesearchaeota archaeon]|jgi:signal recognition particle subunit SRP54|nr:signal recognition particle protein [Candidatus Woesearchaeota archaeon]MBT4110773.1 signal recognition particle protein [Candidatus Woesearchaeota archaeon]MBT4336715.1 signal recognition particle protein [Candidatus Woesearchaeota archaeon]MBT4469536.1 signal recognition particle protein [Candidatus Woesearchaeota archaeon]MBT6743898.1 signal recognition particle protein [Candidatus Woesearchaeota archaeon]